MKNENSEAERINFAEKIKHLITFSDVKRCTNGRIANIQAITGEKNTTINNWLFNSKLPRACKRLAIADAFGVSFRYLYDDTIPVQDLSLPEAYLQSETIQIPYISLSRIAFFLACRIHPVTERATLCLPGLETICSTLSNRLYLTRYESGKTVFNPSVPLYVIFTDAEISFVTDYYVYIDGEESKPALVKNNIALQSNRISGDLKGRLLPIIAWYSLDGVVS